LVDEIARDERLQKAQSWEEAAKFENGPVRKEAETVISYASQWNDDGHISKVFRALIEGQALSAPYESMEGFPVKDEMWLKTGHMCKRLLFY
jgi:hypothetical protein